MEGARPVAVCWDHAPPGDGFQGYRILTPRSAQRLRTVLYSRQVVGAWMHWYRSRSFPCVRLTGACQHCNEGAPLRWRGWLWCSDPERARPAILQITPLAAFDNWERIRGLGLPMPGCQAVCYREGGFDQGRLRLEIAHMPCKSAAPDGALPPLEQVLQRIWFGPTGAPPTVARPAEDDPELIPYPGR